jgi:hypothetical protein
MATMGAAAAEDTIGAVIKDHAAGSCKKRRIGNNDDYEAGYELTRVPGKGGFGVFVKARHRGTDIDVALKFHLRRSPARAGCEPPFPHRASPRAAAGGVLPGGCCTPTWSACTGHRTPHRPGRLVGPRPISSRYVFFLFFCCFFSVNIFLFQYLTFKKYISENKISKSVQIRNFGNFKNVQILI